jgi:hypothetical protein
VYIYIYIYRERERERADVFLKLLWDRNVKRSSDVTDHQRQERELEPKFPEFLVYIELDASSYSPRLS